MEDEMMEAKDYLPLAKDLTPETVAGILVELEQTKAQLRQADTEIERLTGVVKKRIKQSEAYWFALTRIAAVGSTGTIFQSDFEYAVDIAKKALVAQEQP